MRLRLFWIVTLYLIFSVPNTLAQETKGNQPTDGATMNASNDQTQSTTFTSTLVKYGPQITVAGLLLTVLALFLAIFQTRDLKKIRDSLSTRYLGGLSDYYPELIEQVRHAKKSIDMLCDFPAYGCFTHPDYWRAYHYELMNKRRDKIRIHIKCQDEEFRDRADADFFRELRKGWTDWLAKPKNKTRLQNFLDCIPNKNLNVDEINESKFYDLLKEADRLMLNDCFAGKRNISEVKALIRLDYWIIDKTRAIFAFTNYAHGSSRSGFFTTDQKLITALRDIGDGFSSLTGE